MFFDIAWTWQFGRNELRAMSLNELFLYQHQTQRIKEELDNG